MNRTNIIQRGYEIDKGYLRQKSTIGKVRMVGVKLRLGRKSTHST